MAVSPQPANEQCAELFGQSLWGLGELTPLPMSNGYPIARV
jgi:hypothetical protein